LRFTSGVSLSSCSWLVFDCQIASSRLFSTAVMFCEQFWYVVTADGRDSKRRGDEMTRLEVTRLWEALLARVCDWGGAVESEQAYSRRTRSLRIRGSQSQG
jgi:hypothetical protein